MSGLLDAMQLSVLRTLVHMCAATDQRLSGLTLLPDHIDALQAELDRARSEKLWHASTSGYVVARATPDGLSADWQPRVCDDLDTALIEASEANRIMPGCGWHVLALMPLEAFEHQ